jgi:hypothetical protein
MPPKSFPADVEIVQTGNLLFLWAELSLEYPESSFVVG